MQFHTADQVGDQVDAIDGAVCGWGQSGGAEGGGGRSTVLALLQIVGIMGYKNDSPLSLSRQYRDALSGALMISNERIAAKNASMLLVLKEE